METICLEKNGCMYLIECNPNTLHTIKYSIAWNTISSFPNTKEEMDKQYKEAFKKTYEDFKNGNFQASPQHESMADLYVLSMSNALKCFHKNHLIGDYNYLTDNGAHPLPDSFYEAMAWQGLKNHDVAAYNNLPDSKKTELQNSLEANYHATTKNCPN